MATTTSSWGGADHHVTVRMWGEHDLATAAALHATLAAAGAGGVDVVVDLSEVVFMDASTVRVIVHHRELLATTSRRLSLRSPPRCALLLLDACGMSDLIGGPARAGRRGGGSVTALGSWVDVPTENNGANAPEPQGDRAPSDRSVPGAGGGASLARAPT